MLLVVKFRNQIHRLNPALQVDMKNIRINGVARGCSGYITDPATGLVVEVDTEESCCVRERGKPGMVWRGVWRESLGERGHDSDGYRTSIQVPRTLWCMETPRVRRKRTATVAI